MKGSSSALDGRVLDESRSAEIRIAYAMHLGASNCCSERLADEPLKVARFGARMAVVGDLIPALAQ